MANRNVLAIGTSAGGVEALQVLVSRLPATLPATVLVTIHLASHIRSSLDDFLTRAGALPAAFAADGDVPAPGRIYIAPPGRHLLLTGETLTLGTGPRENNVRPSIDPMLRSAALCCGHRTIGVVLTGTQGDGASGLWTVSECSGTTVIQDPQDAAFPEMPLTALNKARPQHIVTLAEMPQLLEHLVRLPAAEPRLPPPNLEFEVEIARSGYTILSDMDRIGRRSVLACPDCHGVMWEIDEGELIRHRCHEGHAHTEDSMELALDDNVRRALGSALRALAERAALAEKLRKQAESSGHANVARHWASREREYQGEADILRRAIQRADDIAVNSAQSIS